MIQHRNIWVAALWFALTGVCSAANFFLDSQLGSDANDGLSVVKSCRSFGSLKKAALGSGDTVFLAPGTWTGDSLLLRASGARGRELYILPLPVSKGALSTLAPVITSSSVVIDILGAKHIVARGIHFSGSKGACVQTSDSTQNIALEDLDISDCGLGMVLRGREIAVRRSKIHDLHMIRNTQGAPGTSAANDDYGAAGIYLFGTRGCTVEDNSFERCRAPSFDYGWDGGAIEIVNSVRNCEIRRNRAFRTDGFMELGGGKSDTAANIAIHHNLVLESGRLAWIHASDSANPFAIAYDKIRFDHNTVVNHTLRTGHFVGLGGKLGVPSQIQVRNNVFVSDTIANMFYREAEFQHDSNLAWSKNAKPYSQDGLKSEAWGDPRFVDEFGENFAMSPASPGVRSGKPGLGYELDFRSRPVPMFPDTTHPDRGAFQSDFIPTHPLANRVTPQGHGEHSGNQVFVGGVYDVQGKPLRAAGESLEAGYSRGRMVLRARK